MYVFFHILYIREDFIEILHIKKLDELKVVTQPVKIIRPPDPFKPKIEGCELSKEREYVVVTKKG